MSLYRPLKALLTLVPKQDIRYYLMGIHVKFIPEQQVYHLEAADGHRAARIVLPAGVNYIKIPDRELPVSAIIPKETVADVLRGGNDKTLISLHIEGDRSTFKKGGVTVIADHIDGRYPDMDRLIPKKNRPCDLPEGIALDASYLGDIGKFVSALRAATYPSCILKFGDAMSAVRIDFSRSVNTDYMDIIYMLMPCRAEIVEDTKKGVAA